MIEEKKNNFQIVACNHLLFSNRPFHGSKKTVKPLRGFDEN